MNEPTKPAEVRPERRREPRYRIQIPAAVVRGKDGVEAETEDISMSGVFVRTEKPPRPRQLVRVRVIPPPDKTEITLHGMVVHAILPEASKNRSPGFGMQFYGLDTETRLVWERFVRYVSMLDMPKDPSEHPRPIDAGAPQTRQYERFQAELRVKVAALNDLYTLVVHDVSKGGMFLRTAEELAVGTSISVTVVHPQRDGLSYSLQAVVRRRVKSGPLVGVGVEFVNINDEEREQFFSFIHAAIPSIAPEDVVTADESETENS